MCSHVDKKLCKYNVMGDKTTALIYIKEVSILLSNYSQNYSSVLDTCLIVYIKLVLIL